MNSWRTLIKDEMDLFKDSFDKVVSSTLSEEEMDVEFDESYGCEEGEPFTVWTETRVYFPVCYDGSEWCKSVSRNPNGIATEHVGGG
jgi:hypothetical protein